MKTTIKYGTRSVTYDISSEGTAFHDETPQAVRVILESARKTGRRLRIEYGDQKSGRLWGDSYRGRIGRSTGEIQVPLLILTKRSMGGEAILDHCIVRISTTPGPPQVIYSHPKLGGQNAG